MPSGFIRPTYARAAEDQVHLGFEKLPDIERIRNVKEFIVEDPDPDWRNEKVRITALFGV